jgi:hypothetical protein
MARFRRYVQLVVVLGAACLAAACPGCDEDPPVAPSPQSKPPSPGLSVIPAGPLTLQVGDTVQFSTRSSSFIIEPSVDYTSSNPDVFRMDEFRNVFRCVAPGTATLTVTARGADLEGKNATVTQTVLITCQASRLIQVTPTALAFTHTVGQTGCPQRVGVIQVFNTSLTLPRTVTVTSSHGALTLDPGSFTLAPNETRDVVVTFNCSTTTSFTATLTIFATSGNATDGQTVAVTGTIMR